MIDFKIYRFEDIKDKELNLGGSKIAIKNLGNAVGAIPTVGVESNYYHKTAFKQILELLGFYDVSVTGGTVSYDKSLHKITFTNVRVQFKSLYFEEGCIYWKLTEGASETLSTC